MQKKLKLDLANLRVDSFSTSSQDGAPDTVAGQTGFDTVNTEYHTHCCPDDSGFSWGSCGTTCGEYGESCQECPGVSTYMTVCVTGCQQCNC